MNIIKNYVLWLFPFFGFLVGYYALSFNWQKKEVIVPSIRGKNLQEAVKILANKNLSLRLLREQEDNDFPQGIVLQQTPQPNKSVKPNQTVFVTISKKPQKIIVPNFLGDNYKDVVAQTKKQGIKLQSFWVKSVYPNDTCIAQYPFPNRELTQEKLTVYLSGQDKDLFVVPNFKNTKLNEVENILKSNDIKWEIICFKKDVQLKNKSSLKVVDQKPMAGSIVDIGKPLQFQLQVDVLSS